MTEVYYVSDPDSCTHPKDCLTWRVENEAPDTAYLVCLDCGNVLGSNRKAGYRR